MPLPNSMSHSITDPLPPNILSHSAPANAQRPNPAGTECLALACNLLVFLILPLLLSPHSFRFSLPRPCPPIPTHSHTHCTLHTAHTHISATYISISSSDHAPAPTQRITRITRTNPVNAPSSTSAVSENFVPSDLARSQQGHRNKHSGYRLATSGVREHRASTPIEKFASCPLALLGLDSPN